MDIPDSMNQELTKELRDINSTRRRKIRKGTFSCWECKRRKRRCERSLLSSPCHACQRNGVKCISQEFHEISQDDTQDIGERVDKVEALVNQLLHQNQRQPSMRAHNALTKRLAGPPTLQSIGYERLSRDRSLSVYLFSVLPHPDASLMILSSCGLFSSPLQIFKRHKQMDTAVARGLSPAHLQATAHPVLLAQVPIQLALCLKQSDESSFKPIQTYLKGSVKNTSRKYYEIASRGVLSHDSLVNSFDGINALILQSRYHVTIGDSHTAWKIQFRAIIIARSMGIQSLAKTVGGRAELIWFQLVYSDRFLSLMIGCPFVIAEANPLEEGEAQDMTSSQRLERLHVANC